MTWRALLVYLLVVASLEEVASYDVNPGIRARLSQRGMQYAANVATDILASHVRSLPIPDQSGHKSLAVGNVYFWFDHIRLKSFKPSSSSISTDPITWTLHKTAVSFSASWRYKYKVGVVDIKDSGSLSLDLDLHIKAGVILGSDSTGRPHIRAHACRCSVTHVEVKFHGGTSWLYNLFAGNVDKAIQRSVDSKLCGQVESLISNSAEAELATLPVLVDVYKQLELDYRLVAPPVLNMSYIDVLFKGEFFWKGAKQQLPFSAGLIDTALKRTDMVNFWMTEYTMNSLGYVVYKHDVLVYNLTKADLPAENEYILNTTCGSLIQPCIGILVPKIGQLYPHSDVFMAMIVTQAPVVDVTPHGVLSNWTGIVEYYVRTRDPAHAQTKFLFSTNVNVSLVLKVAVTNISLVGKIKSFQLDMSLLKSDIGNVSMTLLKTVFSMAVDSFVIPRLNAVGKAGLVIPSIAHVTYRNTRLAMLDTSLYIGADLEYDRVRLS